MAADSAEIVGRLEELREEFEALSALVTGPEATRATVRLEVAKKARRRSAERPME
jgi:hypothetical protein